ncbi:MAG: TatD family hydrolase [Lachnospiraceae bacterium]|nr:TatD family hydrolase [Lachnospiraceae bacterium]
MIFDTHAHYDDPVYEKDREELFEAMRAEGVGMITDIGADIASTKKAAELSNTYEFVYAAAGVHPSEVYSLEEADMDFLLEMAKNPKVVAIGEIGLDYHYEDTVREVQKKWFIRQLELAKETKLPVVIHSRDAAQDTLDIMKDIHAEDIGGVIHCFSYGWEMAKIYLDMGFYLGIGGVVTFKNAKKLKEVVQRAPMDRLVLETDAPYLAPEPYRGKRNASHYLKYVAEEIAALRSMALDEVIRITEENGKQMYRIR